MIARSERTARAAEAGRTALERLQRRWYRRLRAEGFSDIEYGVENGMLKVACRENRGGRLGAMADPQALEGYAPLEYEATVEYYSRAGEMLWHYPWDSARDRGVWHLHCQGKSLRQIASARRLSLKQAFTILRRLRLQLAAWWEATRAQRERESETIRVLRSAGETAVRAMTRPRAASCETGHAARTEDEDHARAPARGARARNAG